MNGEGCDRKDIRRKPSQMFSMRVVSDFITDRLRPGITTTGTSDWAPRATGRYATWMQRIGEKQWEKRREMKGGRKLRRSS